MSARPTHSEISELLADYRGVYAGMQADMRMDQDFYDASAKWGENILAAYLTGLPKGFKIKTPPIAKLGVDIAVNNVMVGEEPEVKANLPARLHRSAAAHEEHRKTMEEFGKAFLYNLATRTSQNPIRELLTKEFSLGLGILSFAFDWAKWPKETDEDYEAERLNAWCWDVHVEHPLNIYPDPYNDPPLDYLIDEQISARALSRRYPHLHLTGMEKVHRVTYLSEEWYAVYINEVPALTEGADQDGVAPNPMGMLWMETVWSGLGDLNQDRDMAGLGKGLIRDARDVLAMYATNLNVIEVLKITSSFATRQIKGRTPEIAREAAKQLVFGANALWPTEDSISAISLAPAEVPPTAVWEAGELQRLLELIFGPAILRGSFQEETASGLRTRVSLAETPFQAGKVNAEQAIANMLRKVCWFLKHELGEKRYSLPYGKGGVASIDTDDIIDDIVWDINLRPVTDEERAFNATRDGKLLESGAITMEEFRRRQGITDDGELDKKRMTELLRYHPKVIDAAATVIAQQLMPQQPPMGEPAQETFTAAPTEPRAPVSDGRMLTSPEEGAQRRAEGMFRVPVGVT